MQIVADLSLYPLKDGPIPNIINFIGELRAQEGIEIVSNQLSTQLRGEFDAVTGAVTWDSGDALEQLTGTAQPTLFNANNDDNDSFDSRSDNKGPEPEGVDLGRIGGRTYAFVGLERQGGIVVVDVTDPTDGRIAGFASNRSTDPDADAEAGEAGDLGPEGVLFVPGEDSPTGEPLLVVGNEVSGTTTVWGVSTR